MCLLYFPITFLFQELSWHFTWIWTPITTATTLSSIAKNCNNSKTTFAWKTVEKQLWELPVWKGRREYRARPQGAGEAAELLWIFKISSTCKANLRLHGFPWSSSLVGTKKWELAGGAVTSPARSPRMLWEAWAGLQGWGYHLLGGGLLLMLEGEAWKDVQEFRKLQLYLHLRWDVLAGSSAAPHSTGSQGVLKWLLLSSPWKILRDSRYHIIHCSKKRISTWINKVENVYLVIFF